MRMRNNQKAIQFLATDGKWKYLFCYVSGSLVSCEDRRKALGERDFEFFENNFADHKFRLKRKGVNDERRYAIE